MTWKRLLALVLLATVSGCGGGGGSTAPSVPGTPSTPTTPPTPPVSTAGQSIPLAGNISPVHDPAIFKENGTYYLFTTGDVGDPDGLLALRTSPDLTTWTYRGPSYTALPAWAPAEVPNTPGMWAPDISKVGDQYRLYYAVSTFGSNDSAIGLATATKLDPAHPAANWHDQGPVIETETSDDYNALDPMAFTDADGRMWLAFGSYWTGLKLIELDPATGMRLAGDPPPRAIAQRPFPDAIEGAYVVRHGSYYYLFASFDQCCEGSDSTYYTVVGRSKAPGGPYVDRAGRRMLEGGGTVVLESGQDDDSRFVGRGHVAILQDKDADYIVYHAYDRQNGGARTLQIQPLEWDAGWPVAKDGAVASLLYARRSALSPAPARVAPRPRLTAPARTPDVIELP